jgi:cytochrome oxidase Cu insertion factor (SCO1/SenC/PrrC family)
VSRLRRNLPLFGVLLTAVLLGVAGVLVVVLSGGSSVSGRSLATNPDLDPGAPLGGKPAADFTLTDQTGRPVSLSSFRGKVVLLDFTDSECTTVCPLTTTAMVDAKKELGSAGSQVQLLGIDANPTATSVHDVLSYTDVHGLRGQWDFLTGSPAQLKAVWKAYGIYVAIERGQIDHTPGLFAIDPQGRLRRFYLTQMSYAAVPQLAELVAKEAASLLPSHPTVRSALSYGHIGGTGPATATTVPRQGGGSVRVGPGAGARLYVFFATWDRQVLNLRRDLEELNAYEAAGGRLAHLIAVDETSVEPSAQALPDFLRTLRRPLSYPVVLDRSGRLADGYEVQDEPWFMFVSATGRITWWEDASTSGWPSLKTLMMEARTTLKQAPPAPAGETADQHLLAGSPAALAALHAQGSRLLGNQSALTVRVHALRGYPVVVNAWASWCAPCEKEFGLLASAAARYGKKVAFLGADTDTSAGDAQAFLNHHYVAYPSYQTSDSSIEDLFPAGLDGLPNTFFIDAQGKVVHVNIGQYASQNALDQDIETYALGG